MFPPVDLASIPVSPFPALQRAVDTFLTSPLCSLHVLGRADLISWQHLAVPEWHRSPDLPAHRRWNLLFGVAPGQQHGIVFIFQGMPPAVANALTICRQRALLTNTLPTHVTKYTDP